MTSRFARRMPLVVGQLFFAIAWLFGSLRKGEQGAEGVLGS